MYRRSIRRPDSIYAMPALKNARHERFALAVADGTSAAKAYRQEWPNSKAASAETDGPALARRSQVSIRISELKKQADEASQIQRSGMVRWLERIIQATPSDAAESSDICETVMTKMGPFTTICSKMSAAEKLIKMAGWNEPEQHKLEVEVRLGGNA